MSGSLVYPTRCILCGKTMRSDRLVCRDCVKDGLIIDGKICAFCGVGVSYCTCGRRRYHYARRIACVYYDGGVRRGMYRLKFSKHTALAEHYGFLMAENVRSKYQDITFDAIIPVPMHWWNRWLRGFDCARLLAKKMSDCLQLPLKSGLLRKRRYSPAQKRIKDPSRRSANVLDTFGVTDREWLRGKTILLVDDVCTTGATLNECAKILRLYGASKVYAVTFAAAVKGKVQKNS